MILKIIELYYDVQKKTVQNYIFNEVFLMILSYFKHYKIYMNYTDAIKYVFVKYEI